MSVRLNDYELLFLLFHVRSFQCSKQKKTSEKDIFRFRDTGTHIKEKNTFYQTCIKNVEETVFRTCAAPLMLNYILPGDRSMTGRFLGKLNL